MNRVYGFLLLIILLLVTTMVVQAGGGGGLWIQRDVISSAGGHMSAGEFQMYSTTGQPVVGDTETGDVMQRAGFWFWYQYKVMVPVVVRQ